jgi:transposase
LSCGDVRVYLKVEVRRVDCRSCGGVKRERLAWLADNPFYTKRFAFFVGRRCRESTVKAVADELKLGWDAVKALDTQYMTEQLRRAGTPGPKVIGIDEMSVGRGQRYRIVVSDLLRRRAIWYGGTNRTVADLDEFYKWLGGPKSRAIRLAVMDMWPPFRTATLKAANAPQALILYDKFHILRHLADAIDLVRKSEYKRVSGKDRSFIKGQKYTLLSHRENLSDTGRASLAKLLKANKRLNTAYLLKESFGQLWDYRTEAGAAKFFDRWKDSLKWRRLAPFQKFAALVERHWDGIASFCRPENKSVPLGFVEGLNNKIRVIHRKAYGVRDEPYLRLKILTCCLKRL